jgi:hypothetical protein
LQSKVLEPPRIEVGKEWHSKDLNSQTSHPAFFKKNDRKDINAIRDRGLPVEIQAEGILRKYKVLRSLSHYLFEA